MPYSHEHREDDDNDGVDPFADDDDDCDDDDCDEWPDVDCWQCHGEGLVIIGEDVPARDIDLGDEGKAVTCPCCNGSGDADDCTYW